MYAIMMSRKRYLNVYNDFKNMEQLRTIIHYDFSSTPISKFRPHPHRRPDVHDKNNSQF